MRSDVQSICSSQLRFESKVQSLSSSSHAPLQVISRPSFCPTASQYAEQLWYVSSKFVTRTRHSPQTVLDLRSGQAYSSQAPPLKGLGGGGAAGDCVVPGGRHSQMRSDVQSICSSQLCVDSTLQSSDTSSHAPVQVMSVPTADETDPQYSSQLM